MPPPPSSAASLSPAVTLLGAVRTGEAPVTPTSLNVSWMVAARIPSKLDSAASGMPPFSSSYVLPFAPFRSSGGGRESRGVGASAQLRV